MEFIFIDEKLKNRLRDFYDGGRKLTVLTGAGLSADSGIPTFRDVDGFWTVGSANYTPEEIATYKMFCAKPLQVWKWFLNLKGICAKASPNKGHEAIRKLEEIFCDRFRLISQNSDGLHLAAGNSKERAYFIHGTLEQCRCRNECSRELFPFPDFTLARGEDLTDKQVDKLKCPKCNAFIRPHVLWFDEFYNEKYYKRDSALRVSKETGLLLVVGTSGATTLPRIIVQNTLARQGMVIDINKNSNYFSTLLEGKANGFALTGSSTDILPEFVACFSEFAEEPKKNRHP
jgi:NAD-dependent deacetylase